MPRVPLNTPIIVGVGEVRNKETHSSHAIEPVDLILQAIQRAFTDASLSKIESARADSISVVPPWTWAYPDLPALLAERLQVQPSHLRIGDHGGNQPALLCDEAARRISVGESQLAIIAGGEALASCTWNTTIHRGSPRPRTITNLTCPSGGLPKEWETVAYRMDQTRS